MRLQLLRRRLRIGWSVPLAYMSLSIVAGLVLPRIEHRFWPNLVSHMSAPAAMTMASAVASGMIALTAIVFSLAFVMVQFSATAYSPRLVLWIARDPVLSHAMGLFSATFLYALLSIPWVDRYGLGGVPLVSEYMTFALLVASMGAFITLIERIGRLQVNQMLIFTGNQGREAIAELYASADSPVPRTLATDAPRGDVTGGTITHVGRPQVIQAIRFDALVAAAASADAVIEVLAAIGDTLVERTPLVRITGLRPLDPRVVTGAIDAGDERTFEQDPKYAIRLLVDIAIRALSPAINDPTTAVQALDQIEDLLTHLGNRRLEIGSFADTSGRVRLVVPFPTWEDYLRLSLDEIRMYGAQSIQVMRRMRALLASLSEVVPSQRLPAVRRWERRLEESIAQSFTNAEERRDAWVEDRQGLGIGGDRSTV
jgi:uncharacterized membrane protein